VKVEISTKRLEHVVADALVVGLYVGETKLPERLARRKPGEGVDRFRHHYPTIARPLDADSS